MAPGMSFSDCALTASARCDSKSPCPNACCKGIRRKKREIARPNVLRVGHLHVACQVIAKLRWKRNLRERPMAVLATPLNLQISTFSIVRYQNLRHVVLKVESWINPFC